MTTVLISCNYKTEKTNSMAENKNQNENPSLPSDTITPKVTGIGGIFFYCDNLTDTKEWYKKHLGIKINDWGSSGFESRSLENPDKINSLQWKPFSRGDEYFSPSKKDFMINYQVQNIEGFVNQLLKDGVTILDSIMMYEGIGKFVHIMDAEGNKIELWEPED